MSGEGARDVDLSRTRKGEPLMKWWKLALGLTIVGTVALLLAGGSDILRFRRMNKM